MAGGNTSPGLLSRYLAWVDRATNHYVGRGRVFVGLLPVLLLVVAITTWAGHEFALSGEAKGLMFGVLIWIVLPVGLVAFAVRRYLRQLKSQQ